MFHEVLEKANSAKLAVSKRRHAALGTLNDSVCEAKTYGRTSK